MRPPIDDLKGDGRCSLRVECEATFDRQKRRCQSPTEKIELSDLSGLQLTEGCEDHEDRMSWTKTASIMQRGSVAGRWRFGLTRVWIGCQLRLVVEVGRRGVGAARSGSA